MPEYLQRMIQFEEALSIVMESGYNKGHERVSLTDSLNRILAEDVRSDIQMPPFNKSAVDGYACRNADLLNELEVIEVIPAGKNPTKSITENKCAKIMTGAPVPSGADVVIMVEDVEDLIGDKIRYLKDSVKNNICYKGEDIGEGDLVVRKNTLIQPQHIAVMATAGCANPLVFQQVKAGVISTGDELVEPSVKPGASQIRNSNAYQLLSQVNKMGGIPDYIGIAMDTEQSTREKIEEAFANNDIVLLTGGVSMGDFDYVPKILNDLGVSLKFKSIAVQPGRPTVFGVYGEKFIFGLPGNPVSSFVQFELLVKPLIYLLMGHTYEPITPQLPMAVEYTRKKSGRLSWMPVRLKEDGIEPLEYHGSAHINALTLADGMISVPIGKTRLEKGELVHVRLI